MKYLGYLIFAFYISTYADLSDIFEDSHGLPGENIKPGEEEEWVLDFFSSVIELMQDIAAIISVLGICLIGLMYIMSRWDEEKTAAAKKYMTAIIIGLVLAMSAWAIIALVDLIPTMIDF